MRSPLSLRRALAALAASGVALGAASTLAIAAPARAEHRVDATAAASVVSEACTVTAGDLTWGFKESFRSYISGTIAHGQWEPIDGAAYTTPAFSWVMAAGTASPEGAPAEVAFAGGIHFTGHDGLLDTTIANPTLVIDGPAHATLRLDVSGVSMEAALAGESTVDTAAQVPFVDIDLTAMTVDETGGVVTLVATDAPTAITADGFAAFGNYEAGAAFDPISFRVSAECPIVAAAETPEVEPTVAASAESAGADALPWGVLLGVGAALVVAAGVVLAVTRARRRGRASAQPAGSGEGPAPDGAP